MKKLALLLLISFLSFGLVGCEDKNVHANSPDEQAAKDDNQENEDTFVREYNDKDQVRSFLTGKWVEKEIGEKRPIAVMLSNIESAMPMYGVSAADILYEAPVEGELTRMMGIFEDYDGLDKIGSVRSCREYFLFYALEFDAIYTHFGQSSYAVEYLERPYVDNLSGLGTVGNTVFYRTDDRPSPHNAYTSTEGVQEGIRKLKYRTDYKRNYSGKFKFAEDGEQISFEENIGKKIELGYYTNKPWFEYNNQDKLYYRFQYGDKHIDAMNDEQLAFTNIVVLFAEWVQRDKADYLAFDCHEAGYALYFTNGTGMEGRWKRVGDEKDGVIQFCDLAGESEVTFNQGKTMVCIVKDVINDEANTNVKIK